MENISVHFGEYCISTDKTQLDIEAIHHFLANESGWSNGIPIDTVRAAIEHSLSFGLFHGEQQIGFARVVSDFATTAYLCDVYVLAAYRQQELSSKMMDVIMSHPNLQWLRRWMLATSTAAWLYQKYGFTPLAKPDIYMERFNPTIYQ